MGFEEDYKKNKLNDIKQIEFGDNVAEITASMEILLTLFEHDDDPDIIKACKERLKEGVDLLKSQGASNKAKQFKV